MNYPHSALAPRTKLPDDFMPFEKSELEQSIPHRFEKMVVNYPDRLAVKDQMACLHLRPTQRHGQSHRPCCSGSMRHGLGAGGLAL